MYSRLPVILERCHDLVCQYEVNEVTESQENQPNLPKTFDFLHLKNSLTSGARMEMTQVHVETGTRKTSKLLMVDLRTPIWKSRIC